MFLRAVRGCTFAPIGRRLLALVVFAAATALTVPLHAARGGYDAVRIFGADYVDVRDVAKRHGFTTQWLVPQKKLRLNSATTRLDFTVHDVDVFINDLRVFVSAPIAAYRGSLYVGRRDAEQLLGPILRPAASVPPAVVKTIVIDPGHGGSDPGNQNPRLKLQEKKMTLDVALRLERLLKAQGFRVVLTRRSDRYVGFADRAAFIRRHGADLFISVHFNAFGNPAVAGIETYVMTPRHQPSSPQAERDRSMVTTTYPANRFDAANAVLGYQMHRQLVQKLGGFDRGLKRFRYAVLRDATCPAVLVEAAFLSNTAEGGKVATPAHRQRIAAAIAAGVNAHVTATARPKR